MQTKLAALTCIYKFRLIIPQWDQLFIKNAIKKLRILLNNKKRIIRKYAGMCITIWSMNE